MAIHHDKLISDTTGIDVVLSVLESGHSVELPATGYSMFPALRPGNRALVNPLPKGALPVVGSVIVCIAQGVGHRAQSGEGKPHTAPPAGGLTPHAILVMHRLVEIKKDDSGNFLLITRGDSMAENDLPWRQDKVVGSVDSFTRNSRSCMIKIRVPFKLEYKLNRLLLWIRLKSGKR
jgi:hypothetical protein